MEDGVPTRHRRVILRLDDGSIIGRAADLGMDPPSLKVVRLNVHDAAKVGRASDKEVMRLQSILERMQGVHGISVAALEQAKFQPPTKKPRAEAIVSAPSTGMMSYASKCSELLRKLIKHFGSNSPVFYNHVDPKLLPDYYTVVKEPLFLKDIESKLKTGQYESADDFHADIKHFFANVYIYNPENDPFRAIGQKAEEYFDHLWATTCFSAERGRRATAGQAAPKFDPEELALPKPKPSRSQGGGAAAGKRSRDATGRAMSHEVTSAKHGLDEHGRVSQERIQQIGMYLSREDLPEEQSNHLISLLPPQTVAGIESGEIELDFDTMDNDTLLRIDAWLRTLPEAQAMFGPPPQALLLPEPQPQAKPSHSRARVDWDDDDEDYEAESDDESD